YHRSTSALAGWKPRPSIFLLQQLAIVSNDQNDMTLPR
ncbi:MAG: hypothetical protein ACI9P7_002047, partial [Candidatus Azotimanducaceae bacterium]